MRFERIKHLAPSTPSQETPSEEVPTAVPPTQSPEPAPIRPPLSREQPARNITLLSQGVQEGSQEHKALLELLSTRPNLPATPEKPSGPVEWREVPRTSRVEGIGDLNGSYTSFVEHLKMKGLIEITENGDLHWTGGDARTVFVGDILGDRNPEGVATMVAMKKLAPQARESGGEIEALAGNHENFFLSLLMNNEGRSSEDKKEAEWGFYPGVFELVSYGSDALKSVFHKHFARIVRAFQNSLAPEEQGRRNWLLQHAAGVYANNPEDLRTAAYFFDMSYAGIFAKEDQQELVTALYRDRKNILATMRNDPAGREILETLCAFKIATIQDDTLFVHTNLTKEMCSALLVKDVPLQTTIDSLNNAFQAGIRAGLFGDGSMDPETERLFSLARLTFLPTYNAVNYSEDESLTPTQQENITKAYRKRGINLVLHGHRDEKGVVRGLPDLPIASLDRSSYKYGSHSQPESSLTIQTSGTVDGPALQTPLRTA